MKCLFAGLIVAATMSLAADLTFTFTDTDGNPIRCGQFYLYEQTNGVFWKALYRHHRMDATGSIIVHDVPPEWEVGCISSDQYFYAFHESRELAVTSNVVRVRIPRTGIAELKFSQSALDSHVSGPYVVPYDRKDTNGVLVAAGGIGIFLTDEPFTIEGLPNGIYRFQLKRNYEANTPVLWSSPETVISNGVTSQIAPIMFDKMPNTAHGTALSRRP